MPGPDSVIPSGQGSLQVLPRLVAEGKAHVAKGLLFIRELDPRVEPGRQGKSLKASYHPAPIGKDPESFDYFRRWTRSSAQTRAEDLYPELRAFLRQLQKLMPGGKFKRVTIIPFCQGDIAEELTTLFPDMRQAVREAEEHNAARLRRDLARAEEYRKNDNRLDAAKYQEAAEAMESQFITHLKVLLRCIRREYASDGSTRLWEDSNLG